MIKGEYKKILWDIFDVLVFFESEKVRALEGFKKKFANQVLMEIRDCLSDDHKEWIAEAITKKQYDKKDPRISEIQAAIDRAYPGEKMDEVSREVFKKILESYVGFMSKKHGYEKAAKLNQILRSF